MKFDVMLYQRYNFVQPNDRLYIYFVYVYVDLCFVCLVQISPMPRERCESCNNWCNRRYTCELNGEMRCKQCQLKEKHNHITDSQLQQRALSQTPVTTS